MRQAAGQWRRSGFATNTVATGERARSSRPGPVVAWPDRSVVPEPYDGAKGDHAGYRRHRRHGTWPPAVVVVPGGHCPAAVPTTRCRAGHSPPFRWPSPGRCWLQARPPRATR